MTGWQALLRRYKNEYHADPTALTISSSTRSGARISLRPLQARPELLPEQDIDVLCRWRNLYPRSFLTELRATPAGTAHYATEVIGEAPDRILFFVEAEDAKPFGHVGLDHIDPDRSYAELDNIVRGETGPAGGMRAAVEALSQWARDQLGIEDLWVHVLGDNPAVGFYEHLGFQPVRVVALRRVRETPERIRWVEGVEGTPDGETRPLLIMERRAAA
jgi:RimJ/RimL family protein N-acetyltransferase